MHSILFINGHSRIRVNIAYFAGAEQRLLLLTIFALSVKYQAVDVSLAVSCGRSLFVKILKQS